MDKRDIDSMSEKELQKLIIQEKINGVSDAELGKKYGINYKYIENIITKTQGLNISNLNVSKKVKSLQPKLFHEEQTSVWSFKQRGNWATHSGEYRGNWSPYIPRNIILKYSDPGDLVLDYFCGSGTTAIECKLLGRKCIALDINDQAIELTKTNLNFSVDEQGSLFGQETGVQIYEPQVMVGDARDLSVLPENSIDLICAHPPYANIIHYTESNINDLSSLGFDDFLAEMAKVAKESFRVLKPGKKCTILIGDSRKQKHVIPLGFKLIQVYLEAGFKLKELIIKRQYNCKTTGFWYSNSIKHNFLLLSHEYLPIFEKPAENSPEYIMEEIATYGIVSPYSKNIKLEGTPKEFETTTVWIFPNKDYDNLLYKNVIERYAPEKKYSIIEFKTSLENIISLNLAENLELIYIKPFFLNENSTIGQVNQYLHSLSNFVNQVLLQLNNLRYIVIQTSDVRIDDYLEPLAKDITDLLQADQLWLKEIIILTQETNQEYQKSDNKLTIVHQYLLVYEVRYA